MTGTVSWTRISVPDETNTDQEAITTADGKLLMTADKLDFITTAHPVTGRSPWRDIPITGRNSYWNIPIDQLWES
jgi:hypothetical protein